MTLFTQKPLGLLDGIYRFQGGLKGVNSLELQQGITLVHDVGRQAECSGLGGAYGNLVWRDDLTVTGGPLESILTRTTDVQPALNLDNEYYELYIMRVSGTCSTSDIGDITEVCYYHGAQPTAARLVPVYGSSAQQTDALVSVGSADLVTTSNSAGTARASMIGFSAPYPIRTCPNGYIGVSLTTGAAATWSFYVELWAGPWGSRPPGLP